MIFLRTSGLARVDEVDESARERLVDEAERFLLAGGRVTVSEWSVLEECEKDCLVEAGLRLRLFEIARGADQ